MQMNIFVRKGVIPMGTKAPVVNVVYIPLPLNQTVLKGESTSKGVGKEGTSEIGRAHV